MDVAVAVASSDSDPTWAWHRGIHTLNALASAATVHERCRCDCDRGRIGGPPVASRPPNDLSISDSEAMQSSMACRRRHRHRPTDVPYHIVTRKGRSRSIETISQTAGRDGTTSTCRSCGGVPTLFHSSRGTCNVPGLAPPN